MARIRTIKPSFFTSLTIADLSLEERLTFIGLWTHCDDEGRCVFEPRLLKAAIWPLDNITPDDLRKFSGALQEASLVTVYEVAGRLYLSINSWLEHQKISHPTKSALPPPEIGEKVALTSTLEDSGSLPGELRESSGWERKGREGKGTGKGTKTPSTAAPSAHIVSPDFARFWELYPRKVGKAAAEKAFETAVKRVGIRTVAQGVQRLASDPNLPGKQFIPHPETWLKQGRWDDEPYSPPEDDRHGLTTGEQRALGAVEAARRVAAARASAHPYLEIEAS